MRHRLWAGLVGTLGTAGALISAGAQTPAPAQRIDPVVVVGCLTESTPNTWRLVRASDPVASNANAPSTKELAALPKGGDRAFELIGVSIFNLPAHRNHSVAIKGLPIQAKPLPRLNVTSVTMVAESCPTSLKQQ
ncbi:MAG: hypothetical protein ACT4QD_25710 [Acidobacteriota bacterium]